MKKFIKNIKKYKSYMMYSAKATLKSEVAGSRLNWLWWILDPFFFMLVYTFVALVVYGKSEPYFPLFVFIGLNLWNYFSKTVTKSVKAVKSCKGMISKVYLPKYILVLTTMLVNLFKMLVAFSLVVVMVPMYHVPITWRVCKRSCKCCTGCTQTGILYVRHFLQHCKARTTAICNDIA